jgi:uncharacterized Zn finger protein
MTTKHRPRFDIDVLRELAGKKVFARGEAYYRDGQVEILAVEPGRVLAQVTGTEDYRTELKGNGEDVDGERSCPAWEDWGFCKHMVATALAANDLRADQPYADVLGEAGLAEYRRLATEGWERIPSYSAGRMQPEEFVGDRHQLMRILDFFAERAGEIDTRIALRAKDLSSQWSYLQLAEFCLSQGREQEALRRAEEGLWLFEDQRPDERLVLFTAELLSKAGRRQDAEACLQRAFEKAPSFELYNRLRKLGGKAARERIVKFLEASQIRGERIRWHNPSDLLIRIWVREKMFDAAWAVVRKHGASMALKEELAGDSEATHPSEALEVYAQRVEEFANAGGASAYATAAKLVARMAKLRSRGEHVAYVLALKERFGRRRNLMKLLE